MPEDNKHQLKEKCLRHDNTKNGLEFRHMLYIPDFKGGYSS